MDRLTEMEAFATVVDQGGFTDAAKKMGISKSAVSKHVSSLEARLGARLLNRTTRRVSPTEIGLAYYDRARRVLNDAGEADALVTSMQSAPSGLLRISVATDFGVNHLSPVLGDFLQEFPDITVNMVLNNRYVELISEGFDLAIRIGELEDSTLRARKLCETNRRMIAAPGYFEKYGRPQKIDDLNEHKLLHYSNNSSGNVWKLTAPSGEKRQVRTAGWLTGNDGQSLLNAAIAGLGIAYLPSFLYAEAMDEGLVQEAIPELPVETQGIFAVYPPGRFTQPKVRAFIDFLVRPLMKKARTFGENRIIPKIYESGSKWAPVFHSAPRLTRETTRRLLPGDWSPALLQSNWMRWAKDIRRQLRRFAMCLRRIRWPSVQQRKARVF